MGTLVLTSLLEDLDKVGRTRNPMGFGRSNAGRLLLYPRCSSRRTTREARFGCAGIAQILVTSRTLVCPFFMGWAGSFHGSLWMLDLQKIPLP